MAFLKAKGWGRIFLKLHISQYMKYYTVNSTVSGHRQFRVTFSYFDYSVTILNRLAASNVLLAV